ncbi:sesquipedalian-1 [Haplochromis burtoni]|uniref:Sesquipedalian n=1 Tax=Haplochromis burtoni TaxID=8153 RepID=A0A3Q3BRM9_HAPBU|nr:sesquipedalian-1 [Haplochromis burtoni]
MKIDEKVLTYFESCNSPVDKEGYLYKKGEIKTSYQKRWFVLKGNLLFYKDRQTDRDLVGVIVLEGCTVQLCESEENFAFSLVWSEPGLRTYKFAAENQASQESWIKALLSASHSYLALLVVDMESKYRDAVGALSSKPSKPFVMPNFSAIQSAAVFVTSNTCTSSALGTAPSPNSCPNLQALTISSKTASKKSPKLRSKKNANAVPMFDPFQTIGEYDFNQLHEDYGKEVKELIVMWSKKGHGGANVQEENLIDFE